MENKIRQTVHSSAVVGGVNVDIWGSPCGAFSLRDSNPGKVVLKSGGVGCNIAHNLCLLGMKVSMITALGDDIFAALSEERCRLAGIDLSLAETFPGERSSVYMYTTDSAGDMITAISDMDIVSRLTPEILAPKMAAINAFDSLVIDANLSPDAIRFLAENAEIPVFADPVSVSKAARLIPVLGRLEALKPNLLEAQALTGETEPEKAAAALLDAGVRKVFISLGKDGILAAEKGKPVTLPAVPAKVVNTSGAGDAAASAVIYGCVHHLDLEETAELAAKAGALTTESPETNCPFLRRILL